MLRKRGTLQPTGDEGDASRETEREGTLLRPRWLRAGRARVSSPPRNRRARRERGTYHMARVWVTDPTMSSPGQPRFGPASRGNDGVSFASAERRRGDEGETHSRESPSVHSREEDHDREACGRSRVCERREREASAGARTRGGAGSLYPCRAGSARRRGRGVSFSTKERDGADEAEQGTNRVEAARRGDVAAAEKADGACEGGGASALFEGRGQEGEDAHSREGMLELTGRERARGRGGPARRAPSTTKKKRLRA